MRGEHVKETPMFIYTPVDERIPADHPLRPIRKVVNTALSALSPDFDALYARTGRPSIPPEQLLRALLLQILFSIRSERLLVEQLRYNMLYQWFVGLSAEDEPWNHSTFSKNRDRLIEGEVALKFFREVLEFARKKKLLSDEHFSVDGTLIDAWASMKSFRPKDENGSDDADGSSSGRNTPRDFRGERRSNDTHRSVTDPDARLYKKSKGAASRLCYMGHVLMENRNGLVVSSRVTHATGTAEAEAALAMIEEYPKKKTAKTSLGADKGYDTKEFVTSLRKKKVRAHVAKHEKRKNIDRRTTKYKSYGMSQRIRKRIEEIFGWIKSSAGLRKVKVRGIPKVSFLFTLALSLFNLLRIGNCTVKG